MSRERLLACLTTLFFAAGLCCFTRSSLTTLRPSAPIVNRYEERLRVSAIKCCCEGGMSHEEAVEYVNTTVLRFFHRDIIDFQDNLPNEERVLWEGSEEKVPKEIKQRWIDHLETMVTGTLNTLSYPKSEQENVM
jgi:hypothetical protein